MHCYSGLFTENIKVHKFSLVCSIHQIWKRSTVWVLDNFQLFWNLKTFGCLDTWKHSIVGYLKNFDCFGTCYTIQFLVKNNYSYSFQRVSHALDILIITNIWQWSWANVFKAPSHIDEQNPTSTCVYLRLGPEYYNFVPISLCSSSIVVEFVWMRLGKCV